MLLLLGNNLTAAYSKMAFNEFGSHGSNYHDRYMQHNEESTSHKLKNAFWTTKQAVFKKLGKKEDEHIVASDSALDAKLELFKCIQSTSNDLSRFTGKYMEYICALSQAENEMGRFLKSCSQTNYTKAGEMMAMTGKTLSFSAQKRISLRVPLERLGQEIDTFRLRAICDCLKTIRKMENKRTEYRGALMWMKNASEELEPDSYKQMEKFRKVQAQVKKTKEGFDKLKIDSMQKIDLLAASRSNLLSHVLVDYQRALLEFWEKTEESMTAIANAFQGYQYYEFSTLKELNIENQKLALTHSESIDDFEEGKETAEYKDSIILDLGLNTDSGDNSKNFFAFTTTSNQEVTTEDLASNQDVSKDDKEFLFDIFNSDQDQKELTHDLINMERLPSNFGPFTNRWNNISQSALGTKTEKDQRPVNTCDEKHDLSKNPNKSFLQPNASSTWMDLFSDLGPLGNPDSIGQKADVIENL